MEKAASRFGLFVLGALVSVAVLGCSTSKEAEQEPTPTGVDEEAEQELTLTGPDVIHIGWEHEPPLRNSSRRIIEHRKVDGDCRWTSDSQQSHKVVRRLSVDLGNCLELIEEGTLSAEGRRYQAAEEATIEAFMERHPEYYGSGSTEAEGADRRPTPGGDSSR